jgi:hypothetical protein
VPSSKARVYLRSRAGRTAVRMSLIVYMNISDLYCIIDGVSSGAASVFVATHDSERGGAGVSLNYKDQAAYTLAHVFTLAYPYGTPTILSSYEFNNNDAGAPNGGK